MNGRFVITEEFVHSSHMLVVNDEKALERAVEVRACNSKPIGIYRQY